MLRTRKKSFCSLCWTRARQYVVSCGKSGAIEFVCPTCGHADRVSDSNMDPRLFDWMPANWIRISENAQKALVVDPDSKLNRYLVLGWERVS